MIGLNEPHAEGRERANAPVNEPNAESDLVKNPPGNFIPTTNFDAHKIYGVHKFVRRH